VRRCCRLFALVLLLLACAAGAQTQPEPHFLLIPLTASGEPGANGSRWVVETFAQNRTDRGIWFTQVTECWLSAEHACDSWLAPGQAAILPLTFRPYHYFYVLDPDSNAISLSAFVRNVGANATPWGTALPIARYEDFREGPVRIRPVPNTGSHRLSVRAYSWPGAVRSLTIELWSPDPETLAPVELLMSRQVSATSSGEQYIGGLYEAHNLLADVSAPPERPVEIRVVPPSSAASTVFWAFASVTHNETQHVTVFEP